MGSFWFNIILAVHVLLGAAVVLLVLLQHGKGADMGATFGSGVSGSLFGSSGSANFLSRTTACLAAAFFATSLGLGYMATVQLRSSNLPAGSVVQGLGSAESSSVPVASESSAPAQQSAPVEIPK